MPDKRLSQPPKGMPVQEPVKIRPEWRKLIETSSSRPHPNARAWTPEEDAFLVEARKARVRMEDIADQLGCCTTSALRRLRTLGAA